MSGAFQESPSWRLVLGRLFQKDCVDYSVLAGSRGDSGLAEFGFDDGAFGYDSSALIVDVCRIADDSEKFGL